MMGRVGQWLKAAIVLALAGGLLWGALTHAEKAGGPSPAALGEAMSKAARQRELTP